MLCVTTIYLEHLESLCWRITSDFSVGVVRKQSATYDVNQNRKSTLYTEKDRNVLYEYGLVYPHQWRKRSPGSPSKEREVPLNSYVGWCLQQWGVVVMKRLSSIVIFIAAVPYAVLRRNGRGVRPTGGLSSSHASRSREPIPTSTAAFPLECQFSVILRMTEHTGMVILNARESSKSPSTALALH